MISKKTAQKIKELEIHTQRILKGSSIGKSRSRQKGFGFEFDQLRLYQYGDDVRLIDWKSSLRSGLNNLLVRQYFEERNRTFIICLDISASTSFGSKHILKQDMMQQITGALSLAAEQSKDKVGLILFSDQIEAFIPPGKGKYHVHRIIEKIFTHEPSSKKTDINVLLEHIAHSVSKNSIVFVISDFITDDFEKSLKRVVANKEMIAISCLDAQEVQLDNVGLVWMEDAESQQHVLVDTRKRKNNSIKTILQNRIHKQKKIFQKHKVDFLHIQSKVNFIQDLVMFFQKRLMY